jgi:hypothetical protein
MPKTANILGDIRAEADKEMLQVAFYETPDYRTLIESADRPIVVGRRGTGKSALCLHLSKYWRQGTSTTVIDIVPHEDQVIGIRPLLARFGSRYNQVKAGARIAWKYAILLEVGSQLDWARELWNNHRVLVVKLTGNYLSSLLSKLRSIERILKADPCDLAINKLLDTYRRLYLSGARIAKPPGI